MEKMENEILMTGCKLSFVRRAIVSEWASAKFDILGTDVLLTVPSSLSSKTIAFRGSDYG